MVSYCNAHKCLLRSIRIVSVFLFTNRLLLLASLSKANSEIVFLIRDMLHNQLDNTYVFFMKVQDDRVRLQLHGAIYRPDSFVMMLRYCENLKAIRYESTSLKDFRLTRQWKIKEGKWTAELKSLTDLLK